MTGPGGHVLASVFCFKVFQGAASQLFAFPDHRVQRHRRLLSEQEGVFIYLSQGSAEDGRGKDQALVGIDAAGGGKHLCFGVLSGKTEPFKKPVPGLVPMLPADAEKIPEPGDQGGAAVHKGEKVHILVGAGIIPVHQAGLWRSRYLIEQGADGCLVGGLFLKIVVEDLGSPPPYQLHGMGAVSGTDLCIFAADQAGTGRKAKNRAA